MDSSSLNSKASQETFISLLQLDPAPIPDTDKDLPPLPEEEQQLDLDGSAAAGTEDGVAGSSSSHGGGSASVGTKATATTTTTTGSLGLSGSGHGAVYYLSRIQRYSSYTLTIFTMVHLATTSLVPLVTGSVASSESPLLLAREIYQTRLSEPLLVGLPLALHVASGVALRLVRRSQNLRRYGGATPGVWAAVHHRDGNGSSGGDSRRRRRIWPPLSAISLSGYAAAALVLAHTLVNRGLPLLLEGDSADVGLAYVAHGFARRPAVAWPAYVVLLAASCGHVVWGWARWVGVAGGAGWDADRSRRPGLVVDNRAARRRRRRTWLAVNGCALAAALVWAAGGLGVVARGGRAGGWVGQLYDGMFEKVWL